MVPILSQMNPVHILTLYYSNIHFNIILPFTPMPFILFCFFFTYCCQTDRRDIEGKIPEVKKGSSRSPLSAVRHFLFDIDTLHIWRPSPPTT